jgi:hypothetical protein
MPSRLICGLRDFGTKYLQCLTYLSLDLTLSNCCLRTDYDIATAYSYDGPPETPFISTEKLNLRKLLHIRNFWQRHLTNPDEGTFYTSFPSLCKERRPKPWEECICDDIKLGNFWLGYYCDETKSIDVSTYKDSSSE